MRVFNPPSGFTPLHEARNKLRRAMHEGVSASAAVERLRNQGLDVSDHNQTVSAVELLRKAIMSGDLAVYVDFPLSARPRQLSPEFCQIAIRPKDGTVLTFAYIPRHPTAPFDVSWSILNQLPRALLLIEKQRRSEWQYKEKQKKAWPCHAITANTKKGRGRPRRIDDVIEVLKEKDKRGELNKTSEFKSSLGRWRGEVGDQIDMSQMNPFFSNQIRMVQDGEDVDFVFEANGSTLTLMTVVDTEVGDFTPDDFIGQNSFFG